MKVMSPSTEQTIKDLITHETFEPTDFGGATELHKDLGMDSLDLVQLEVNIADRLEIEVDLSVKGAKLTVQDVLDICREASP